MSLVILLFNGLKYFIPKINQSLWGHLRNVAEKINVDTVNT